MSENANDIIAIDGPAGSGKSTTARLVAQKLGFTYLDTGAMYRALTLKAIKNRIDIQSESEIIALMNDTEIELRTRRSRLQVLLDGEDVTRKIRSREVTDKVSTLSALKIVREWMVHLQRKLGKNGKVVAEGRDIGTVVFSNAQLKIFLVASLEERAKRRQKDYSNERKVLELKEVTEELSKRDRLDSTRAVAPLKKASDAIELDTTRLTIEQQVEFVVEQWLNKQAKLIKHDKAIARKYDFHKPK